MCIVDPSGFNDTRGPNQQIINSYAIAKMFKKGVKSKILLVIEHDTFKSGYGADVVKLSMRFKELFPKDFNNLTDSIMIVVSKVNPDELSEDGVI